MYGLPDREVRPKPSTARCPERCSRPGCKQFFAFSTSKRHIGSELLTHVNSSTRVFNENRARVLAAGRPLLLAAQRAHDVRDVLTLEQTLDVIIAIARIHGTPGYLEPILQTALGGLRPPTDPEPA